MSHMFHMCCTSVFTSWTLLYWTSLHSTSFRSVYSITLNRSCDNDVHTLVLVMQWCLLLVGGDIGFCRCSCYGHCISVALLVYLEWCRLVVMFGGVVSFIGNDVSTSLYYMLIRVMRCVTNWVLFQLVIDCDVWVFACVSIILCQV